MNKLNKGILTMAYGNPKYIRMAKALAKSLNLHSPNITRAIVTDSKDSELKQLYHISIALKPELGSGVKQKLYIDEYSPFAETLFIDSDCLVVKNIEDLWKFFNQVCFGVVGWQKREGKAFMDVMDVPQIMALFNLDSIPVFNGGLYYFKKNEAANKVFLKAREIGDNYEKIGLGNFRGGIADEPAFAIAIAMNRIRAISDEQGLTMRTPYNMTGSLKLDVLQGISSFIKEGQRVNPAIVHFCDNLCSFDYKREQVKLELVTKFKGLNYKIISFIVNLIFVLLHPIYMAYKASKKFFKK
ncbi:MAG: hypothetical protein WBV73_25100 [Phormidium sp.]